MKEIFEESYKKYNDYMSSVLPDYWQGQGYLRRRMQIESFINSLNDNFQFENLIVLETGASFNPEDGNFGLFLGYIAEKTNGKMFSVDINRSNVDNSYELFKKELPNLNYVVFEDDSIKFLSDFSEIPNIVHLDSWDLNLKDPFPSALHSWREFSLIESKMPTGSIIIIDDNYINGTWVDWHYPNGSVEKIDITYPMIGKGAHIYQYVLSGISDWNLIGTHYNDHTNIKVIIQKK